MLTRTLLLLFGALAASAVYAEESGRCDLYVPERQALFGDTHVHTSLSHDARLWDTRNTPGDAYRFARGETLGVPPYDEDGTPARTMTLARPLDFAMVSDHAENLGLVEICYNPLVEGYKSLFCRMYRHNPTLMFVGHVIGPIVAKELSKRNEYWRFLPRLVRANKQPMVCGSDGAHCRAAVAGPWRRIQDAAERAYDRSSACTFTSFVGYEWTGYTQANIHRNVIFRNEHVIPHPVSFVDVKSAPALWDALDKECVGECEALTIPHNSNVSLGLMFPNWEHEQRYNLKSVRASHKYERIVEVMQHKGDSECWYGLGADDAFCAFEKLPQNTLGALVFSGAAYAPQPGDGYLRNVLSEGLRYRERLGINPWEMGFIASTDNHLGTPGAVTEQTYIANTAAGSAISFLGARSMFKDGVQFNPGGLAAVWAEENARDSIFEAMKRREVYGTSGPRILLRFFAGANYDDELCEQEGRVKTAYEQGVPMGAVLEHAELQRGGAPRFMAYAAKDTGTDDIPGTDLQRIQIVKGWLTEGGEQRVYIYDMAGGENGASVDTTTCEQRGDGAAQLCGMWEDHDFDPKQHAWYYARVLENPSCRWHQHLCAAHNVDCSNPDTVPDKLSECCSYPPTIQERAWSAPIWYYAE